MPTWRGVCGAACAICLAIPLTLHADFYDGFHDGQYVQDPNNPSVVDPNLWDIDNPHWDMLDLVGSTFFHDASDGWLWLFVDEAILPLCFLGAAGQDGQDDPNNSAVWFDDSAAHYVVAKVKFNPAYPEQGGLMLYLHADVLHWNAFALDYNTHDEALQVTWISGIEYRNNGTTYPPEPDDANGFWVAFQFDPDDPGGTGDPNDPNNHWYRAAVWDGGKFDWDGTWDRQAPLTFWEPNDYPHWSEGRAGIAAYGSEYTGPSVTTDCKWDDVEVRWGLFSNVSHTLSLTVKNGQMGTITIDPDLLDDPNNIDPNSYDPPIDPSKLRRYTDGTEIVLVAEAIEGKSFKEWKIYDPNHPGDSGYATKDTNSTLYLTMDADWEIEASFKCGSSEMLPVAVVLLTLTLGMAVRRIM